MSIIAYPFFIAPNDYFGSCLCFYYHFLVTVLLVNVHPCYHIATVLVVLGEERLLVGVEIFDAIFYVLISLLFSQSNMSPSFQNHLIIVTIITFPDHVPTILGFLLI